MSCHHDEEWDIGDVDEHPLIEGGADGQFGDEYNGEEEGDQADPRH